MEVLYGSQQERSHMSVPASSAISCRWEHFSLFKMYSDISCLKLLMFVLRKTHPKLEKTFFATCNILLLYSCIFASILISYN